MVFLLFGLQVNQAQLAAAWPQIAWAIGAVLVARQVIVYSLGWLTRRNRELIPTSWQHVMRQMPVGVKSRCNRLQFCGKQGIIPR